MAREVVWTNSAWLDLDAAAEYVARDSRAYAAALIVALTEAAGSLATLADRGRSVPEASSPSIREIFVGRYRVVYSVAVETVYILAIIHGARDFGSAWSPRQRGPQG